VVLLIIPIKYIPFIYTAIFSIILVNVVPRKEIRRLFIYGLIFGGVFDVVLVEAANLIGEFKYVNYGPFGMFGIHFMAPIAWTVYYIIYFYLLPKKKIYLYLYTAMGVFDSIFFCQMITKLGVLQLAHGLISSIIPFVIWFPIATWGYLKLIKMDDKFKEV
jgi:hypothetical protein